MLVAWWLQVFPLWGITDRALGGLGFGSDYVGLAQASSGIALVSLPLPVETNQPSQLICRESFCLLYFMVNLASLDRL